MMPFDERLRSRLGHAVIVTVAALVALAVAGAVWAASLSHVGAAALVGSAALVAGAGAWIILAMRKRLRLVQEALDTTPAAIAVYDARDHLVMGNRQYRQVLGVPENAFKPGAHYADLVRHSLAMTLDGETLEEELSRRLALHRAADGRPSDRQYPNDRWLRVSKVKTPSGANVGIALDVTEYYELKASLETQVRRFEALAASAPVGICQVDGTDRVLFVNGTLLAMTGTADAEELEGRTLAFTYGGVSDQGFCALVRRLRENGAESEVQLGEGPEARDVLVRKAFVVPGDLGRRLMPCGQQAGENILIFIDITDRKHAEARIRYFALHDPLTGAFNRLAFNEDLPCAVEAASEGQPASLVAIDLDRFKPVNDVYGHPAGDELLRQLVGRITPVLKSGMTLYRMGGDEFAVLVPPGVETDPVGFARDLVRDLCRPFQIDGRAIRIGASAGVSSLPQDADNVEALVHYADLALYRAKRSGGGEAVGFDRTILSGADDRRRMKH